MVLVVETVNISQLEAAFNTDLGDQQNPLQTGKNEGEPMMQGKQSRISVVTLLGTFVLSTALVSGIASAQ